MFHSNKKKEKKALTEEEQKKLEEKLEKIKAIQNRIIKMRRDNETDIKNLDFIIKAGILMPDFSTMWSYRKQLILHQKTNLSEEEFYKFVLKEVENIFAIMMQNPKSYVLWYHR
jgi:geranylgeranyl transferase type-2 subunit alpha